MGWIGSTFFKTVGLFVALADLFRGLAPMGYQFPKSSRVICGHSLVLALWVFWCLLSTYSFFASPLFAYPKWLAKHPTLRAHQGEEWAEWMTKSSISACNWACIVVLRYVFCRTPRPVYSEALVFFKQEKNLWSESPLNQDIDATQKVASNIYT